MDRYQGLGPGPLQQVYPSHILRTVQIQGYEYLQRVGATREDAFAAVDDVPGFTQLLQDLQRGTYHASSGSMPLPAEHVVARHPAGHNTGSTTSTAPSTVGGTSSAASVISTLTTTTAGGGGNSQGQRPNSGKAAQHRGRSRVPATQPSQWTGTPASRQRPPRNDAGQEFCVAWWCKGGLLHSLRPPYIACPICLAW